MITGEIDIDLGLGADAESREEDAPQHAAPPPVMAAVRGEYDDIVRIAPQDVEIEIDSFDPDAGQAA